MPRAAHTTYHISMQHSLRTTLPTLLTRALEASSYGAPPGALARKLHASTYNRPPEPHIVRESGDEKGIFTTRRSKLPVEAKGHRVHSRWWSDRRTAEPPSTYQKTED
jgi:hypothetical protein